MVTPYNPDRMELIKLVLSMADQTPEEQEQTKKRIQELAAILEPKK